MNNYKYLFIDGQWLLTRIFKQKCSVCETKGDIYTVNGKVIGDANDKPYYILKAGFKSQDLVTTMFQSVAKYIREVHRAKKVILLWDKYPYHKFSIVSDYKADRYYAKEEDTKGLDPIADAKKIIRIKLEVEQLAIKQDAKHFIIQNFGKIGIPSIVKTGYEGDDLAGEVAKWLEANESEKSALLSIDSDWDFLIRSNTDHVNHLGKVKTYSEMMEKYSPSFEDYGMTLYEYKSWVDSINGSHNNLKPVLTPEAKKAKMKMHDIIGLIKEGKDDILTDRSLFDAQLKSFSVKDYPDYDVISKMLYYIPSSGSILDPVEFGIFSAENGINVRTNYYSSFINLLDSNLYQGK